MEEDTKRIVEADKVLLLSHIDDLCNDNLRSVRKEEIQCIYSVIEHIIELTK